MEQDNSKTSEHDNVWVSFKIKAIQQNIVVKRPCPDTAGNTAADTTSECIDGSIYELSYLLNTWWWKKELAVNIVFKNESIGTAFLKIKESTELKSKTNNLEQSLKKTIKT